MSRLDPVAQQMIDDARASGEPNAHLLSVPDARARFESTFAALTKPEVNRIEEISIPVRDGSSIRGRLYVPAKEPLSGLIVYFHGGGWLLGSIDSHDVTTRKLANASGIPVLSVDYRRGPEARFPTAVEDAADALEWATSEANPLAVEGRDRVAVSGDSAGANLAAAVANERSTLSTKILHQLLVFPITTTDLTRGVDQAYEGIMLEYDELVWHQENYLSSPEDRKNPRVNILDAELSGAPAATVIVAECDPVRPQGELYADALRKAGVSVDLREYAGMIHGFFGLDELFPTAAVAMSYAAERLQGALR